MELKNNLTMFIHSCDKFSDLWDGHVKLLEENWGDRNIPTYILTDKENERSYENVKVIAAGEGKELSERTAEGLKYVETEYVFVTLDDYFLIEPVSSEEIGKLLDMMEAEKIDYIRLHYYPKPTRKDKIKEKKNMYRIDTNKVYAVNMYAGIWRKSFLESTIREPKNAWQYEVSLSRCAREYGANCIASNNKEFVILDVVRKGKILREANRYFKKHDVYHGERPVMGVWAEFTLGFKTWFIRLMPKFIVRKVRAMMIKRGHHFYSQDA